MNQYVSIKTLMAAILNLRKTFLTSKQPGQKDKTTFERRYEDSEKNYWTVFSPVSKILRLQLVS